MQTPRTKKQIFFLALKCTLAFVLSLAIFVFLIFPYSDLGDLVCTKVAEGTKDQVFCQVESINLSLFPTPALKLQGLQVEGKAFPKIEVGTLKVSPNILYMLSMRVGASFSIEDLFKSQASGSIKLDSFGIEPDKETDNDLFLQVENLNLKPLVPLISGNFDATGSISANIEANFDRNFVRQPEVNISITSSSPIKLNRATFILPGASGGPISLRDLAFNQLNVKGFLNEGTLTIENIQLGDAKNEIFIAAKGRVDLSIDKGKRGRVATKLSKIDVRSQIRINRRLEKRDQFLASSIEIGFSAAGVKPSINASGSVYTFRVRKSGSLGPPQVSSISQY